MKKTISVLLALALCLGLSVPALAAGTFTDVPANNWAAPYIERAASLKLVDGVGGGRFGPNQQVTYGQFATMLDNIAWKAEVDREMESFINSGCEWWEVYCYVASEHGLFDGTEIGSDPLGWGDSPKEPVSRTDMAVIAYNFMKANGKAETAAAKPQITDIGHLGADQTTAVAYCVATGILSGTGNSKFSPDGLMTRAQAATVLCSIYDALNGTTTPVTPNPPVSTGKPAGAVGGQYDLTQYTVPADANKDGWITEAEVQAVIDQLKVEYPTGTHWGSDSGWSSPVFGYGRECAGFAFMVSDKIFGDLPYYEVSIGNLRVGDYMRITGSHSLVAMTKVGDGKTASGNTHPLMYNVAEGNVRSSTAGDRVLTWQSYEYASQWPTGTEGTYIWSRYPKE